MTSVEISIFGIMFLNCIKRAHMKSKNLYMIVWYESKNFWILKTLLDFVDFFIIIMCWRSLLILFLWQNVYF